MLLWLNESLQVEADIDFDTQYALIEIINKFEHDVISN